MPLLALLMVLTVPESIWEEDFDSARRRSESLERPMLIYFSGSDWCANCIRLKREVLETREFVEWAEHHVVLFNADFPRKRKSQPSDSQQQILLELLDKLNPNGEFPKLVLIDLNGFFLAEYAGYSSGMRPSDCLEIFNQVMP